MGEVLHAVFTILCCINTVVFGDVSNCQNGEIDPMSPYFLEGEPITLNCSRDGGSSGHNNLYFLRNNEAVDSRYIQQLNGSAIQMKLPPLTKRELNQMGTSVNFLCMDGDTKSCVRSVYVDVEYELVAPQNVNCRVYNWERMRCSCSLGVIYKYPDDIEVKFEYKYDNSFDRNLTLSQFLPSKWNSCPKLFNKTTCIWEGDNFYRKWRIFLRVMVLNKRRDIDKFTNRNFIMDEINEPAPVIMKSVKKNETCVRVKWKPYSRGSPLHYNLMYYSRCDRNKTIMLRRQSAVLCDLVPNNVYNISVAGQFIKRKKIAMGYWSKPQFRLYKTESQVPSRSPDTILGLHDQIDVTSRNLTIYWQPLDLCEMNSVKEKVFYVVSSDIERDNLDGSSYNTQLSVSKLPANITIKARNEVGEAPTVTVVTVFPSNMAPSPSELIVQYTTVNGKGSVQLTVVPREQANGDITNISHTLVMCKGSDFCLEPVQWRDLLDLRATETVSDITRFGLITRGYHSDQPVYTGIVWQKCVYVFGESPAKPEIKDIQAEDQPVKGFRIEWLPQDCKDETGYIQFYEVHFCSTMEQDSHTCSGWEFDEKVDKQSTSFTKTDLRAGSHYTIWLKSVGIKGSEQDSAISRKVTTTIMGAGWSSWKVATVLAVLGVVLVAVFVIGACCLIRRCKETLANKKQVRCEILDDLSKDDVLGGNTTTDEHMTLTSLPDANNRYSNPCTDSGHSSMNSQATNESRETDRLLANCDSDSAINLNQYQDEGRAHHREFIDSMTASQEKLDSYQHPNESSGGTIISIYGGEEDSEESQETETCLNTERHSKDVAENDAPIDCVIDGEKHQLADQCSEKHQLADHSAEKKQLPDHYSEKNQFADHCSEKHHYAIEERDVCKCEMEDSQTSHMEQSNDSSEQIDIHKHSKHDIVDSVDHFHSITSNSDDPLDGYYIGSDIKTDEQTYHLGSLSDLSELSVDDSEEISDSEKSTEDIKSVMNNGIDAVKHIFSDTEKFASDLKNVTTDGLDIEKNQLLESEHRPVEGGKHKETDIKHCDIVSCGAGSELAKKNGFKVPTAGHSSGDYHKVTLDSSGTRGCDVRTVS